MAKYATTSTSRDQSQDVPPIPTLPLALPEPNLNGIKTEPFFEEIRDALFYGHPSHLTDVLQVFQTGSQRFATVPAIDIDWCATEHLFLALLGYLHNPDNNGIYDVIEDVLIRLSELRERLARQRLVNYHLYLETAHWATQRQLALQRAKDRCQLCYSSAGLNVHHKTYERLFDELPDDLIVLCRSCHAKFHGKLP